ncbi:hypothetical protein Gohar_014098, partial [Gossypium harknessii]|nr:hypothetical protein [Gossypium harknessii]
MGEICKLESKVRASSFFSCGFLVNNVGKKEEVEELFEKGRFLDALVVDDVLWIGQMLPTSSMVVDTIAKSMIVDMFEDGDENLRVRRLFKFWSEKGRFALILDDVCERFFLEKVGIPKSSRAKLVLTSRPLG